MGIEVSQSCGIEADSAVGQPAGVTIEEVPGSAVEGRRDKPCLLPEADKRLGGRGPRPRLDTRQHLMPEKRPGEPWIGVRRVLAPRAPPIDQKPPQPVPSNREEGAEEGHAIDEPPGGFHSREPSHPRPAQRPMEDRLGLIVGRVGHEQMPCPTLVGGPSEPAIAETPGAGLEPLAAVPRRSPQTELLCHDLHAEIGSERHDETEIVVGLGPQAMVGVGHEDPPTRSPPARERDEGHEQGDAVGSARNADEHRPIPQSLLR